jgi:hypothetical protein
MIRNTDGKLRNLLEYWWKTDRICQNDYADLPAYIVNMSCYLLDLEILSGR